MGRSVFNPTDHSLREGSQVTDTPSLDVSTSSTGGVAGLGCPTGWRGASGAAGVLRVSSTDFLALKASTSPLKGFLGGVAVPTTFAAVSAVRAPFMKGRKLVMSAAPKRLSR